VTCAGDRPDGFAGRGEYNDLHQPITVVDPDGAVWRREYNAVGNLVALTDPAGAVTHYSYDEQNHLASTTDPLGAVTHVASDAAGLPIAVTDPLGAVTRYERIPSAGHHHHRPGRRHHQAAVDSPMGTWPLVRNRMAPASGGPMTARKSRRTPRPDGTDRAHRVLRLRSTGCRD